MAESVKAHWDQIESILRMDGVVDVQWKYPLIVVVHKDIKDQVRAVLCEHGYKGEITFADFPNDLDAVIDYQAQHLNNFDLLLMPSSSRPDLGDFPYHEGWEEQRPLWSAVDDIMKEHGVTTEQFKALRRRLSGKSVSDINDHPDYRDFLIPLFRALRKRGFSARELTG